MAISLQACCQGIESSKITERKKNVDELYKLIEDKAIQQKLTKGTDDITWNDLIKSVHQFLILEADKLRDDERKKRASSSTSYSKRSYGDLFISVVRKAHFKGKNLNVSKLVQYIRYGFNSSPLRKYFSQTYLIILKDTVLSSEIYCSCITSREWLDLLQNLKQLYHLQRNDFVLDVLHCFHSLLLWGPHHSLSSTDLRQEFSFITELISQITDFSSTPVQEVMLNILIKFCEQTAEDCRMSCCRLGEDIINKIIDIYQSSTHDKIKLLALEFFTLQTKIHHPMGALQGSVMAYACSWSEWSKQLRILYSVLCKDIDDSIQSKLRPVVFCEDQRTIQSLPHTYVVLLVEVFRQVRGNKTAYSDEEPPAKRQKTDFGISGIINYIKDDKEWKWINIMTELLKKYPDLLTTQDFITLLRVLSELQRECKYINIRYHLYNCLIVLADIEKTIDVTGQTEVINSLWSVIWECTLRAIGLNEHINQTHTLLQKLITECKTVNSVQLFRTYMSQVVNATKFSLATLNMACSRFGLPHLPLVVSVGVEDNRKTLLNWILNVDYEKCSDTNVFAETITAEILLFLTFKQWPERCNTKEVENEKCNSLEYVYLISSFDSGIILHQNSTTNRTLAKSHCDYKNFSKQIEAAVDLNDLLYDFVAPFLEVEAKPLVAVKNITNIVMLLANTLTTMIKYSLLEEENLENHKLVILMSKLFEKWWALVKPIIEKMNDRSVDVLTCIQKLFTVNTQEKVFLLLRKQIPIDFIKALFEIVNDDEGNKENAITHKDRRIEEVALDVLCCYCCIPNENCAYEIQQHALGTLVDPADFNPLNRLELKRTMKFLLSLDNYKPGTLSTEILNNILIIIQNICESCYKESDIAVKVLKIMHNLYSHIALTSDGSLQENSVALLKPFYEHRDNYGSSVSSAILDCMGRLSEVDPDMKWSKWDNEEIVIKIPHFLSSSYLKVRLAAIKTIHMVFSSSSVKNFYTIQQNAILEIISQKCREVFTVDHDLTDDLKVDETVTRTASALHSLAMVIISNPILRQRAMFALLHLVYEKKLNLDSTQQILDMIAKHLDMKDCHALIEWNLKYLVSHWYGCNYDLAEFPYNLLGCSTDIEFYSKFTSALVPILVAKNVHLLEDACKQNGASVTDVIEGVFPDIIARCFLISTSEKTSNETADDQIQYKHACLKNLENFVDKEKFNKLIVDKLEKVIEQVIRFCFDPADIKTKFLTGCALPVPQLPYFKVSVVVQTIEDIQVEYLNGEKLIQYFLHKCPDKLQNLLMMLITAISNSSTIEDKIKAFHQCSILIDLIMPALKTTNKLSVYFIRSISYTLIHSIQHNYESDSLFNRICCRYFYNFITNILPENAATLQLFLVTFVSILVPIAKCDLDVGEEAIKLLKLLIVDHRNDLKEAIRKLDPFPEEDKFVEMQTVYQEIKYETETLTLQEEIEQFLITGSLMGSAGYRTEGLKHLKNQLASKKLELKELYSNLQSLRGFSEECNTSILHKLVSSLIKLSCSQNFNESVEATRCLGELGSADLLTTVLQTEKKHEFGDGNAFELVTGCITALLCKYIVDPDVDVMQVSSLALYQVLDSAEGRLVLDSQIDYGQGVINKEFVTPFISPKKTRAKSSYSLQNNFRELIHTDLWCPQVPMPHKEWITNLTCTLLQTFNNKCYLNVLIPVCRVKVEFAEHLLPLLVYLIVSLRYTADISAYLQTFFQVHWNNTLIGHKGDVITLNKLSVKCTLDIVHFIRLRKSIEKRLDSLNLNYLHVAQAAQFCTAHFTALLYVELWSQEKLTEIRKIKTEFKSSAGTMPLDLIIQHESPDIQKALKKILKESYNKIGEYDAARICDTIDLLSSAYRVHHYENLQQWDQAMLLYDIQVSQGDSGCIPNLLHSMKNFSLYQLPLQYEITTASQLECAWRLGHWNINKAETEKINDFEKYKYFTLKALHDNNNIEFDSAITDARTCIVNYLKHTNLESSKSLYEPLSHLQALQELEDFLKAKNENLLEPLLANWKIQNEINPNEFNYTEPIYTQRITVLNNFALEGDASLKNYLVEMYLKLIQLARVEGKTNVANRALGNILRLNNLPTDVIHKITLEQAQMCWNYDKTTARYILRTLLTESPTARLQAAALKLFGTWMVDTCSENPQVIITDYFTKSLEILNNLPKTSEDVSNMNETYDALARFSDMQYQQIQTYIKSSVFESKVQNMQKSEEAAANITRQSNLTEDERKAVITHTRQSKIDKTEISSTLKEKNMYLQLSIKYYLLNLHYSDLNNLRVFRILSLWLENRSNTEVTDLIRGKIPSIPSYKFIPVLPQLIPHISNNVEDAFSCHINSLIERCTEDHPHHTLPYILALANANEDRKYFKSKTNTQCNEPRILGAQNIIDKFATSGHPLHQLINQMQTLANALMELAYLDPEKCKTNRDQSCTIPNSCAITKIKNFDSVLLPTFALPVRNDCVYSNIIGIASFGKTFALVGGLNAPKRITCQGTDGEVRSQLVKGKDDLRQDAVMQQVFNIMNELFRTNKKTTKLLVRTYKIVPLSQRSGILEWVQNSMPLSDYLVGKVDPVTRQKYPGAHQKYNKGDLTPDHCRLEFKKVARLPNEEKLKVYQAICKKFGPVLHKFFEESFVQPAVWYERQRAYTYSVATSSMCGYILGLGDRHVLNILIDKKTAEVIHIDFGIAFEQGRVLPTPETVPFRLSRDVEAGMGISGVEGVFRKSCEKTLEVLRKNSETIITILEVLLYDPLYAWTITPAEAYSHQFKDDHDGSVSSIHSPQLNEQENIPVNTTAERALLRLRQKLEGTTENGSMSIEGQVEKLIQQARDPSNLCRLFVGWQPYL